jgi:ubiquinone/menaquinone biosynthesis C-methylase UbiE
MKYNGILAKYDTYDKIAGLLGDDLNISFMNHGYYPIHEKASHLFLDSSGSLYCHFLDRISNPESKKILEVGCGRGGGANLIKTAYNFAEVHACDLEEKAIDFCRKSHSSIHFEVDDAQTLSKYESNSFDCVINVESSHCYRNIEGFFSSVHRVLKSEGTFLYIDAYRPELIKPYEKHALKYFRVVEKIDIVQNVYDSCIHSMRKIHQHIRENKIPPESAYHFLTVMLLNKAKHYKSRAHLYYAYVLIK